jgi:xanthine/uracil permease
MLKNTMDIPLSVGAAFRFPDDQIATTLQVAFIFTGIVCILQAVLGHYYYLMEDSQGIWWALISAYAPRRLLKMIFTPLVVSIYLFLLSLK